MVGPLALLTLVQQSALSYKVATTETVLTETLVLEGSQLLHECHALEFRTGIEQVFLGLTQDTVVLGVSMSSERCYIPTRVMRLTSTSLIDFHLLVALGRSEDCLGKNDSMGTEMEQDVISTDNSNRALFYLYTFKAYYCCKLNVVRNV